MLWDEWGRLTRFLESARIAFGREFNLWDTLELADANSAKIRVTNGETEYRATLVEHREAVSDSWLLHASVLVTYYSLAEAAAANNLDIEDASSMGGIEVWGQKLLDAAGTSWEQVAGGKAGAVHVAVVRNIVAHGERSYSQRDVNRMQAARNDSFAKAGDPVVLTYQTLLAHRACLKSLLRVGMVEKRRGTIG